MCQILFWPGFSCSVLLQRVRFGVVAHVPTPQQETVSLPNDANNSWCFSLKALGCVLLSSILLHAHSCREVLELKKINSLTRGKFHWVNAQSFVVTKEKSSEVTSRFLESIFQGVLHTQVFILTINQAGVYTQSLTGKSDYYSTFLFRSDPFWNLYNLDIDISTSLMRSCQLGQEEKDLPG